jgi:hypothetical protein
VFGVVQGREVGDALLISTLLAELYEFVLSDVRRKKAMAKYVWKELGSYAMQRSRLISSV